MSSPRTPWRAAAEELLADGEWHPIEEVRAVMMAEVPFAVAVRWRRAKRVSEGWPLSRCRTAASEALVGKRGKANESISNAMRTAGWEQDGIRVRKAL